MIKRLSRDSIFETLKEARNFYSSSEIKEKIRTKLSEDLPFKVNLDFVSFNFRKRKAVSAEIAVSEVRHSGEDETGLMQTRCFVGTENFRGLGQGYSVTSVLPSEKDSFMSVIKNEMEGLDAALHSAAIDFSESTMRAVEKEKTGILSYCFFDKYPAVKSITTKKPQELPALSDIEKIAKQIAKKIELADIKKRTSNVSINVERDERILVNSEGTEIVYDPDLVAQINFGAKIETKSGSLYVENVGNEVSWRKLLDENNIERMLNELHKDIEEQKNARKIPPGQYDILFLNKGLLTALHEAYAAHLGSLSYLLDQWSGAFSTENLGKKISLEEMTIESDPRAPGKGKWGYYEFDDEGARAKKITLLKKGILVGMLSDRESASRLKVYEERVRKIPLLSGESNGHARISDPSKPIEPRISNLIIKIEGKQRAYDELKNDLCSLLASRKKEYGLIIDSGSGYVNNEGDDESSSTVCVFYPSKAYKIYPDGKIEPVLRKFNISVQPRDFLSKIYALGGEDIQENHYCGADSGYIRSMSKGPAGIVLDMSIEDWKEDDYKKSIT